MGEIRRSDSPFSIAMLVLCMVSAEERGAQRGKGDFYVLCSWFLL